VEIVAEKHVSEYQSLVDRHALNSEHTWMVGNSPKSDINPALGAGLNAVFVPHDDTWVLEHEELADAAPARRLLVVKKFSELVEHF
jgi:putative hydrolase of the HAD superfamily